MRKKMSLRQLLTVLVRESQKQKGETIFRSEIHEFVEHILNNSTLELAADYITLKRGNRFGVGEDNKDKCFIIPRFLFFDFGRLGCNVYANTIRNWILESHDSLDALEKTMDYKNQDYTAVVMVDGEVVGYGIEGIGGSWGHRDIRWEKDIYELDYIIDDREVNEKFKSIGALERYIKHMINEGATELSVYNLIEGVNMGFSITASVYDTGEIDKHKTLIWKNPVAFGFDEGEDDDIEDFW